jgi:hypothetical protein
MTTSLGAGGCSPNQYMARFDYLLFAIFRSRFFALLMICRFGTLLEKGINRKNIGLLGTLIASFSIMEFTEAKIYADYAL